ncbi:MAG: HigA family addiction module antidote protein [Gammaproteobacteria bacterium]|nr:HigA family addiction module antidote protein [Gammaproteobacteria bacterium]
MSMFNPPHPGETIKDLILDPLGMSTSEAAEHLGISHKTLSKVLNGRGAITPEIALRLEMAFKPSAESWLHQQSACDLWQARRHFNNLHVLPVEIHAA